MPEATVLVLLCVLAAWLTWKYVERPFRELQPARTWRTGAVAAFSAVTAFGIGSWVHRETTEPESAERLIVREQLARAARVRNIDVGFFGDSSCLTGIDAAQIRAELRPLDIESFCMFGTVGPVADAAALNLLARRHITPKVTIIVIHPAQYERTEIEPEWAALVREEAGRSDEVAIPESASLKGVFSGRYKSAREFALELREKGSVVDPRTLPENAKDVSWTVTSPFRSVLRPLAEALSGLDRSKVYILFPPLPEGYGVGDRSDAAKALTEVLGLPGGNVIPSSPIFPRDRFASRNHLNEKGRAQFSAELAALLQEMLR
jgi:hypothetical protein